MTEERRQGERRSGDDQSNLDQFLIGKFAARLDFQDGMLSRLEKGLNEFQYDLDMRLQLLEGGIEQRLRKLEDSRLQILAVAGFVGLIGGGLGTVVAVLTFLRHK